ncbi:MAG TPA: FkbM family methyltransferase [Candidatus Acidoferrum sp.]|nr:FkbM family methyltransferase [Candidatus Acidoferrum sp.]
MAESGKRLANLLLRFAPSLVGLRRVPVLGEFLSWTSRRLVPGDSLVWIRIQHGPCEGLSIRVNPRTGQNVQQGIGEPQVQEALVKNVRPGMTFYDVGANIGFFSLMAARLVGPQGRVVSFEADPEIAARLRENLARNQFTHAQVEEKAVWSEPAVVSFARVDPNTSPDRGLGHVSTNGSTPGTISVDAVSLDQYAQSHAAPDFLKCDVEGAELAVFEGAAKLLSGRRTIFLVEMHSPENHRALLDQFAAHGYRCKALDENHVLALPQ